MSVVLVVNFVLTWTSLQNSHNEKDTLLLTHVERVSFNFLDHIFSLPYVYRDSVDSYGGDFSLLDKEFMNYMSERSFSSFERLPFPMRYFLADREGNLYIFDHRSNGCRGGFDHECQHYHEIELWLGNSTEYVFDSDGVYIGLNDYLPLSEVYGPLWKIPITENSTSNEPYLEFEEKEIRSSSFSVGGLSFFQHGFQDLDDETSSLSVENICICSYIYLSTVVRIDDEYGNQIGITGTSIGLFVIEEFLEELNLENNQIVVLINKNTEHIMASNRPDLIDIYESTSTLYKASQSDFEPLAKVYNLILKKQENDESYNVNDDFLSGGKTIEGYIVGAREFDVNNMEFIAITMISKNIVFRLSYIISGISFSVGLVVFLFASCVSTGLGCCFSYPLTRIIRKMKKLENMDLDVKIGRRHAILEIRNIQRSLNFLVDKLKMYRAFLPEDILLQEERKYSKTYRKLRKTWKKDTNKKEKIESYENVLSVDSEGMLIPKMFSPTSVSSSASHYTFEELSSSSPSSETIPSVGDSPSDGGGGGDYHGTSGTPLSTLSSNVSTCSSTTWGSKETTYSVTSFESKLRRIASKNSHLSSYNMKEYSFENTRTNDSSDMQTKFGIGMTKFRKITVISLSIKIIPSYVFDEIAMDPTSTGGIGMISSCKNQMYYKRLDCYRKFLVLSEFLSFLQPLVKKYKGWVSEFDENLKFRIVWNVQKPLHNHHLPSCIFALSLCEQMKKFQSDMLLKGIIEEEENIQVFLGVSSRLGHWGTLGTNERKIRYFGGEVFEKADSLRKYAELSSKKNYYRFDYPIILEESISNSLMKCNSQNLYKFVSFPCDILAFQLSSLHDGMVYNGSDIGFEKIYCLEWNVHQFENEEGWESFVSEINLSIVEKVKRYSTLNLIFNEILEGKSNQEVRGKIGIDVNNSDGGIFSNTKILLQKIIEKHQQRIAEFGRKKNNRMRKTSTGSDSLMYSPRRNEMFENDDDDTATSNTSDYSLRMRTNQRRKLPRSRSKELVDLILDEKEKNNSDDNHRNYIISISPPTEDIIEVEEYEDDDDDDSKEETSPSSVIPGEFRDVTIEFESDDDDDDPDFYTTNKNVHMEYMCKKRGLSIETRRKPILQSKTNQNNYIERSRFAMVKRNTEEEEVEPEVPESIVSKTEKKSQEERCEENNICSSNEHQECCNGETLKKFLEEKLMERRNNERGYFFLREIYV